MKLSMSISAVTTDRGDNVVNGRWSIGSTGKYPGVGTEFLYNRGVANCPGECITAIGPTTRRITVQVSQSLSRLVIMQAAQLVLVQMGQLVAV